ncbi:hypothetical protein EDD86DRAFT_48172 [Gorgonomyces haynaldii]|nr:hypothetical protein EDD86DRAFT_48172 [Gorgonomyces haynaldii]
MLISSVLAAHWKSSNDFAWSNVTHLVTFGDSWTTTGFTGTLPQPTLENPLSIPSGAPFFGYTSANGPNYVYYLTLVENKTQILTYNMAYSGATVDGTLIPPYAPQVYSIRQQVDAFEVKLDPASTLYSIMIGINDVDRSSHDNRDLNVLYDRVFESFSIALQRLMALGIQHLLILNIAPVHVSPLNKGRGSKAIQDELAAIELWHQKLNQTLSQLIQDHPVSLYYFDTFEFLESVIDNPQDFGLKNATDACPEYNGGTPALDTYYPECGVKVSEYFWSLD